jgi:acid stress chaperone HdeB
MKKSTVIALALVSAFAFSNNAFAKKQQSVHFNMHDLSCGELITMDEESMGVMLMWLDGYLSGVTGDTTFDEKEFTNFAGALGEYCVKNKTSKVIDASNQVGVRH